MSRLSKTRKVDFFCQIPTKEYLRSKYPRSLGFKSFKVNDNLKVNYFPYLPGSGEKRGRMRLNRKIYTGMTRHYINKQDESNFVLWIYHPKDLEVIKGLSYQLLIYDCMDDFKEFMGAEDDLRVLEEELLKKADLVFTGGKKMFKTKASRAKECYFLPCGVDYNHFAKPPGDRPAELQSIKGPIAGYFGALDERLDIELLLFLVESCKDVNFVFIGPILKVDFSPLFDKPNVYHLGEIDYSRLPDYGAFMDACLIPFALTELTKTMNPTKTLEYFALGKPVISTALPDVIELFGDLVYVAKSFEDFAHHLSAAIGSEAPGLIERRRGIARDNSWESAIKFIEEKIENKL